MGQDHPPAPPNWARGHACWQGPIRVLEAGSKLNKHHPLGQTRRPVHKSAGPGWTLSGYSGGVRPWMGQGAGSPRPGSSGTGTGWVPGPGHPGSARGAPGGPRHTPTHVPGTQTGPVGSEDPRVPFQSQAPGLTGQTRCCGEGWGRGPREAAPSIRHGDGSQPFQNSGSRFRTREAEGCLPSASHRSRR